MAEQEKRCTEKRMVSIIIPTYQRSDMLCRAIDSCLNQTVKEVEIIVVDDNDPDTEYRRETERRMQGYASNPSIKYIRHPENRNGSAARNTGILASEGDYITFLDDDDVLHAEKIGKQLMELEKKGHEYGVVCTGVQVCHQVTGKRMKLIRPEQGSDARFDLLRLRLGVGTGSNPLFRREAIESTGLFDTSFLRHQDTEYLIRVLRNYKMAIVHEILITKYESGHPNRPDVEQYLSVQNHFLQVFQEDIEEYTERQQSEIYRNNWHQACIVAIDGRNWRIAGQCFRRAGSYQKHTPRMVLGIMKHIWNNHY